LNILLTGGAGYIGSHAAVVLFEAGHEVIIYDNFCNSDRSVLLRLEKILGKSLVCVEGDIRDSIMLENTFDKYQIQAVMHFAGLKAVGESVVKPLEYYDNNVRGSLSLVDAMSKKGIRKMVFSSSATVYGEPQYLPLDEKHPINPINPYGRSKAYAEQILRDMVVADPEWTVVILRYFNPAGAHESGLIGEEGLGAPNNLVPYLTKVGVGILEKLKIFGCDYPTKDGTGVRDYIHVMDLADGHIRALNFALNNHGSHEVNLGLGEGYSVLEVMREFELQLGRPISYEMVPRRSGDVANSYTSNNSAQKKLAWEPKRNLSYICRTSLNWEMQRKILKNNKN